MRDCERTQAFESEDEYKPGGKGKMVLEGGIKKTQLSSSKGPSPSRIITKNHEPGGEDREGERKED